MLSWAIDTKGNILPPYIIKFNFGDPFISNFGLSFLPNDTKCWLRGWGRQLFLPLSPTNSAWCSYTVAGLDVMVPCVAVGAHHLYSKVYKYVGPNTKPGIVKTLWEIKNTFVITTVWKVWINRRNLVHTSVEPICFVSWCCATVYQWCTGCGIFFVSTSL